MDDNSQITNKDLYDRMAHLERKMDAIQSRLEQATGAWTFIKILASITLGASVLWGTFSHYFFGAGK